MFSTLGATSFTDLRILVNRGGASGADTQGLAIDLGELLDDASETGVFLCVALPCAAETFAAISAAPDLAAAALALGDWLNDPENLPDGWGDVQAVFQNWTPGSEIAAVYVFDIDVESWTNVELRANSDDGLLVWIDGSFVFGATGPGGAIDDLGFDYRLRLPDLAGGRHVLQILAESRGPDDPALIFELRGEPIVDTGARGAAVSVPEPGSLTLFAFGLIGVLVLRRRGRILGAPGLFQGSRRHENHRDQDPSAPHGAEDAKLDRA